MNAADYTVVERVRDGRSLRIRALRPADRAAMAEFVGHMSDETRYRRFFAPKRTFSEREIEYFLNVDFVNHVALVAILEEEEDGKRQAIAGGGRYIVSEPGRVELAFTVDDSCQKLGIAMHLMKHLVIIAREAGIRELVAQVLPDNVPMLKVFGRCGLPMVARHESGVVNVTLDLSGRGSASSGAC